MAGFRRDCLRQVVCGRRLIDGAVRAFQNVRLHGFPPAFTRSDDFMGGFFSKDRIIAPPGFNRWRVPPASIALHLCIGSVYAWRVFNPPLMKVRGVVASAAGDWSLTQVTWIVTVAIVSLGCSAAVAGRWMEHVGPRTVGLAA